MFDKQDSGIEDQSDFDIQAQNVDDLLKNFNDDDVDQ